MLLTSSLPVCSGVVHMVGGGAALVGAALLGPRLGRFSQASRSQQTKLHLCWAAVMGSMGLLLG